MVKYLPSQFRSLLLASGFALLLVVTLRRTTANFEAYGVGSPGKAPEGTVDPNSTPAVNIWNTIEGTHPPRVNETYGSNIPNIANFDVLAIYATWLYSDPDIIYLHTNAAPEAIERARSGTRGKWNAMILGVPQLIVKHTEPPDTAGNGVEITRMEHKSDFVRVAALEEYGGIYLDTDAIPLRDLRPLLETGFNTVLGRQLNGEIMSGNFIGKAGCQFFTRWRVEMHEVYNQEWVTHSNEVMTRLAKRLSRLEREVLVMESPAMGPIHWKGTATQAFYSVQNDVESNLEGLLDGDPLPYFNESQGDGGNESKNGCPEWQSDDSDTYILHSWHEERGLRLPKGFDHVTPRYVLERRSDFARAVYPIVKHMYEYKFVSFDDPWRYVVLAKSMAHL